jgi:factor associated with neutral sphingomyelinase activation
VFFHLCYEGAVELSKVTDANEKYALETQIMEFGQVPLQLFTFPHPPRRLCPIPRPLPLHHHHRDVAAAVADGVDNDDDSWVVVDSPTATTTSGWVSLDLTAAHSLHKFDVTSVSGGGGAGNLVCSTSLDSLLKIYDWGLGVQVRCATVGQVPLAQCQLLPDGNSVVVGSWDKHV